MSALALTKVVVQAVYKEWINSKPRWVTDSAIQRRHNFTMFAYQKLDTNAPNYFSYNRGTETGVYLKYIVDHYNSFPDVAIFVHAKPYEHQVNWLNMIGCISPNATWFNINYGQAGWNTRSPEFWLVSAVSVSCMFHEGCMLSLVLSQGRGRCGAGAMLAGYSSSPLGAARQRQRVPSTPATDPTNHLECHVLQPVSA